MRPIMPLMLPRFFRLNRLWAWLAIAVLGAVIAAASLSAWWVSRYALAVHRLKRGIGDTMFYGANGQPWFRLDEQRHDVPLGEICLELQRAVVAVEDHRFFYHPGLDPVGIGRAFIRVKRNFNFNIFLVLSF